MCHLKPLEGAFAQNSYDRPPSPSQGSGWTQRCEADTCVLSRFLPRFYSDALGRLPVGVPGRMGGRIPIHAACSHKSRLELVRRIQMQKLSCALPCQSEDSPKLRPDIAAPIVEDRVCATQVLQVDQSDQHSCTRGAFVPQSASRWRLSWDKNKRKPRA